MKRILSLVCSLILFLSFFSACASAAEYQKHQHYFFDTFDTVITLIAYTQSSEEFQQYAELAETEMRRYHQIFDQYNPYDSSNSSFSFFAISLMKKKMLRVLSDNSLRKIYLTEPVALNKDEEEVDIFGFINSEDSERFVKDLEDKEFIKDVENYINTSIPENWREILKMHLGIGYDKQYSFSEIRRLTGFSRQYINVKMKKLLTKVKGFVIRKDPLLKSRSVIPDKEKMHEEAFNEYYGLDGSKVQRDTETIKQRYGFKRLEASIKGIEEKFIKSGKYTPKQIEDFKNSRKERLQKEKLDFYFYCYYSYYGLNEHTRKSISELAFEFNRSISGISLAIKSYKDYLNMKAENKQEAIEDDQPTA